MITTRPQILAGDRIVIGSWPALGPCLVLETGIHFPESYPGRPSVLVRPDALPDRPCWFFADECTHVTETVWIADSVQPPADSPLATERQEVG